MDALEMDELKEFLKSSLLWTLVTKSPILSGSMQVHIQPTWSSDGTIIVIEAPFYDQKEWRKNQRLVYTGESKYGFTDYAQWVNDAGGFGRHNKSEHWVNRVVNQVCKEVARKYDGIVEGELEK